MKSGKQRRKKTKPRRALGAAKRIHLKSAKRIKELPVHLEGVAWKKGSSARS